MRRDRRGRYLVPIIGLLLVMAGLLIGIDAYFALAARAGSLF